MVVTAEDTQPRAVAELLELARAGDMDAFCRLAEQHDQRLLQQACGLARDRDVAEDLVSETLVEAWRSLHRYNGGCRFSTWLFAILLHRHQKHLRRARSRPIPLASLPTLEAAGQEQAQEGIPAPSPSPADEAMGHELAGQLREAVSALPEKHQAVVLLRFFEDASLQEISAAANCSIGTVKSRLHYALEKLRVFRSETGVNLSELWRDTH
jgi:RNA polymerase sigma-70 factor, ECF subfamily